MAFNDLMRVLLSAIGGGASAWHGENVRQEEAKRAEERFQRTAGQTDRRIGVEELVGESEADLNKVRGDTMLKDLVERIRQFNVTEKRAGDEFGQTLDFKKTELGTNSNDRRYGDELDYAGRIGSAKIGANASMYGSNMASNDNFRNSRLGVQMGIYQRNLQELENSARRTYAPMGMENIVDPTARANAEENIRMFVRRGEADAARRAGIGWDTENRSPIFGGSLPGGSFTPPANGATSPAGGRRVRGANPFGSQ